MVASDAMEELLSRINNARYICSKSQKTEEIVICKVSEFPSINWVDVPADFLIQGDLVILTEGLDFLHEESTSVLAEDIVFGLNKAVGSDVFRHGTFGQVDNWRNVRGCHQQQSKIADSSVAIKINFRSFDCPPGPVTPIIFETAFRHESLGTLLNEAVSWLSCKLDCHYVVTLKISGTANTVLRFRLIVSKRSADPVQSTESSDPKSCSHLLGNIFNYTTQQLENFFDIKIVYDHSFAEHDLTSPLPPLQLNSRLLLQNSNIRNPAREHLVIDLESFRMELKGAVEFYRSRV